jgi:putative Mg2+ transporter-C (MgtC) family protein
MSETGGLFEVMFNPARMDIATVALRLAASFVAGALVGLERSWRRQVAGLRTHVLICSGAALLMILSIQVPALYGGGTGDAARIAAQIVSGMGFLGAGAILRLGNNVKGLTTAASLWVVSATGMAFGAGLFISGSIAVVISLLTLTGLERLESHLFPAERNKILELDFLGAFAEPALVIGLLKDHHVRVQSIDLSHSRRDGEHSRLRVLVGLPSTVRIKDLIATLWDLEGLVHVELKEKY